MYNKNLLFSMVEKHITLHFSNLDPICNFILQSHRFLSLSSFFSHRAGLRGLLPTYFPSYTLPHSYYFHETNFELDQLPDLAQQLKQAVRSGAQPPKVKLWLYLSADPQPFNNTSTCCCLRVHPTLSSTQSSMANSLHFKHRQFTPTFHFLSFK